MIKNWLYQSFITYKNAMEKNDTVTAETELKILTDENCHQLVELLVLGDFESAADWIGEQYENEIL